MIRKTIFAAAILAGAASPALAADLEVEYDRARLSEPAYVEALKAEIKDAAYSVCKQELIGSPLFLSKMRTCVRKTTAESVKKVAS